MDKAGHLFSAYTIGRWGHAAWDRCGARERNSILVGGSLGLAFLTGVELLDGTSSGWGFSWSDMLANTAGAGLFMGQQALWQEQRITVKFSARTTSYAARRPDVLGKGLAEQILKDYNGHTIWFSANLDRFMPGISLPPWMNLAIGHGAEGMLTGTPEAGDGRYRQFYMAPDIDLTRIPARRKWVRTVLFVLNGIKVPLPGIEIDAKGRTMFRGMVF